MELAVFILLLLIAIALVSPFVGVSSLIVNMMVIFLDFVARVICGLVGFAQGIAVRGRDWDDREGQ